MYHCSQKQHMHNPNNTSTTSHYITSHHITLHYSTPISHLISSLCSENVWSFSVTSTYTGSARSTAEGRVRVLSLSLSLFFWEIERGNEGVMRGGG